MKTTKPHRIILRLPTIQEAQDFAKENNLEYYKQSLVLSYLSQKEYDSQCEYKDPDDMKPGEKPELLPPEMFLCPKTNLPGIIDKNY